MTQHKAPTPSDMVHYLGVLDDWSDAVEASCGEMKSVGMQKFRLTRVSNERPHPPYPDGLYLEGWLAKNPAMSPFGEERDGSHRPLVPGAAA